MMHSLSELLTLKKTIRVIGFDDAPFEHEQGGPVKIAVLFVQIPNLKVCFGVK